MTALSCKEPDPAFEKKPVVHIEKTNSGYQLIRNGKPYYIKGGAASADRLEELKKAGANTARIYDTTDLGPVLDKAASLELAVVVDIPLPKFNNAANYYEDEELFQQVRAKIGPVVKKYKDHPALLYWNLGNELYYPYFFNSTRFYDSFNSLIDLVHRIDPNHPVSTTTIGANKLRVLSIINRSPQLDFISFNSFGTLSSFQKRLRPITPLWNGPHVITEWGVNGPWEAINTTWGAPIEETSTKKAEQISQRYHDYIEPLKENNSFGSFVFYWGQKNEITPTWYSFFRENKKSQAVFELEKIWKDKYSDSIFPGPELDYILLNGRGAPESVVLSPGERAEVETILPEGKIQELEYSWEIRKESWNDTSISEKLPIPFRNDGKKAIFKAPSAEGPYRVHLFLFNGTEYFASANIPFYVLKPVDEE